MRHEEDVLRLGAVGIFVYAINKAALRLFGKRVRPHAAERQESNGNRMQYRAHLRAPVGHRDFRLSNARRARHRNAANSSAFLLALGRRHCHTDGTARWSSRVAAMRVIGRVLLLLVAALPAPASACS